ncbi:MAG: DNA cytosine methyltransferase [Chloroflexi bacterium]|nr:DNA cytosine methyltransferase [Chloroflexota bacterium]
MSRFPNLIFTIPLFLGIIFPGGRISGVPEIFTGIICVFISAAINPVPSLSGKNVFLEFVESLKTNDYFVSWSNVYCPGYGVPQNRRRLVLFASKFGKINMVEPTIVPTDYITIKDAIGHLQPLEAGETNNDDPLHRSSNLSDLNLKRIQASVPGGTWSDWEQDLVAECHLKDGGKSYFNVYGRMEWDKPSPTITTQFYLFGTGRFGHPEQDRALSLREGAILQSFPENYDFLEPDSEYYISRIARHIGNAVPVGLARAIAQSIKEHLISHGKNP